MNALGALSIMIGCYLMRGGLALLDRYHRGVVKREILEGLRALAEREP